MNKQQRSQKARFPKAQQNVVRTNQFSTNAEEALLPYGPDFQHLLQQENEAQQYAPQVSTQIKYVQYQQRQYSISIRNENMQCGKYNQQIWGYLRQNLPFASIQANNSGDIQIVVSHDYLNQAQYVLQQITIDAKLLQYFVYSLN
ncbi:Hypothetical_protein [Hexamita inflata]|uniref:Hypothetical_protein n=1 Tax=Hexamita inflata TaxID=28002 RepID=A0AA86R1Y7_9EUKA|nr:Hypothetical protein HINF_LOCUS32013 [Hexamita inflata]CAI9964413.1 Hypothetical protein HINF_LOCUS52058 [Hexamita inflata]